jgi:aspartate ammonia-lyase
MSTTKPYRIESDLLGSANIPKDALYGIQTWRAVQNFDLSGVKMYHFKHLVRALAMVKQAAARANAALGKLPADRANIIELACQKLIEGEYTDSFVVDMIQGGAGTSTNMNANEVIANIGLTLMGHAPGDYQYLHPNNDINMSQSTNDAYPTSVRLAILLSHQPMVDALKNLQQSFAKKGEEFAQVLKMGRTQLQDAVPMTLGQEFNSWSSTLREDVARIADLSELLKEMNLGGTAIGTGINADPRYATLAIKELTIISGFELIQAEDLVEASSDMGGFVLFSGMLKRSGLKLSKIANDLRLLSMGPRAGLNEINLPPQQPGSSIMPGKINPVIPEAVNQVAYQVMGNDLAICMAAEAGQLQLNAMEPLIAYNLLESMRLLTQAMKMFEQRCVTGITANVAQCREYVDHSLGIATALNPVLGYEVTNNLVIQAQAENKGIIELVREQKLLVDSEIERLLEPSNMLRPTEKCIE